MIFKSISHVSEVNDFQNREKPLTYTISYNTLQLMVTEFYIVICLGFNVIIIHPIF